MYNLFDSKKFLLVLIGVSVFLFFLIFGTVTVKSGYVGVKSRFGKVVSEVLESFVYTLDEFLGRFFNLIIKVHSKHILKPSFIKVLSVLNDNL